MDAETYTDDRVAQFITAQFLPARLHVREQADDFKRFAQRYGSQWTPTILQLDPEGNERHRIEGFLPAGDFLANLKLGAAQAAFKQEDWKDAERLFRDIVSSHPDTDAAPEALYWAGVATYKGTQDAEALAETANAFSTRFSDTSWAKKASVWARKSA